MEIFLIPFDITAKKMDKKPHDLTEAIDSV